MDQSCKAILDQLNSKTQCGHYIIVDYDELKECLPDGANSPDDISLAIESLRRDGYLSIRYERDGIVCLTPLKCYVESLPAQTIPPLSEEHTIKKSQLCWAIIASFVGAFLGAFLSGLLC
jgi:hypothetical protein